MKGPDTERRSYSFSPLPFLEPGSSVPLQANTKGPPTPLSFPCSWNKLLNVAPFPRSVSPTATVLPNPLVISLQSPDLISQQRLAVDGSLS